MSHLTGKARDVVKIALRSDPALDVKQKPELIYNVLLHYFSEAPSSLPLVDFYATLPSPSPFLTEVLKGEKRRGKQNKNMSNRKLCG